MEYIIFDLEWNNVYNYKTQKGMNEIIEIGAVKLNDNLDITDTFKQLIKPRLSKKLGSRFKNLTNITMDEINRSGVDFEKAFADFARWCIGSNTVFLSWSTSDLYTLADNFKKFTGSPVVDFMQKYADVQKYCMQFIETENNNQISLSHCAQLFDINTDELQLHRALEDCYVEALCFKKVFNIAQFEKFIRKADVAFFERLVYKPKFVTDKDKDFNVSNVEYLCPSCNIPVKVINDFTYQNNSFKGAGKCTNCNKKFWIFVRAKRNYDSISVYKRLTEMNKKRAKYID